MKFELKRHEKNPIIIAGGHEWRQCAVFNPGVILEDNTFYLYERAAKGLRPFECSIGLLKSSDGVNFELVGEKPVLAANDLGHPAGTVEDPRIVKIEDEYLMTYAYRPYTYNCNPTGTGLPEYEPLVGELDVGINHTVSGIARGRSLTEFEQICSLGGIEGHDERDTILFPEKINGRYAILRRPKGNDEEQSHKNQKPSIWISYSDDLITWDKPHLVAQPKYGWEGSKIGGGTTPLKCDEGWIIIYHGVNEKNEYRAGIMLLDINDPTKVIARSREPVLEPKEYYEKVGLVVPNVVFPTGNVIKDNVLYVYYGCCDTSIALATANMEDVMEYLRNSKE